MDGKKDILIVGAGPAGLSAASLLTSAGHRVTVLEKSGAVGGLSGSFAWKGHTLDYGPHTLHVKSPEITGFIKSLYAGDPENLLTGKRNIRVYLKSKMFHYPLSAIEVLLKLNPLLTIRAVFEFLFVSLIYSLIYVPEDNFESWGIRRFGKTLYGLCFGNYTEKVWKMPAREISFKFASEKVRGMDFKALIKKILGVTGKDILTAFWTEWLYPRGGSRDIYDRMRKGIENGGGEVLLEANISRLCHENGRIKRVEFEANGARRTVHCDWVISTIPVKGLVALLDPPPSDFVLYHASKLNYRSLILVYCEVDREKVHDAQWFYLLDPHFVCNRISEQRNISPFTIHPGRNVLTFELTCNENDSLWNMEDGEILNLVKKDMERIRFMGGVGVLDFKVARIGNAYEVYGLDFDKHRDVALDYLSRFSNLATTGRKGLFLQNDMHDSLRMGIDASALIARRDSA